MYKLYTDGACKGNPGPGGWGICILHDEHEYVASGYEPETTNNRMEIQACIEAIKRIPIHSTAELYTDSQYVVNTMNRGWQRNKNIDLWATLDALVQERSVTFNWVKGHAANFYNNKCDELAVQACMEKQGINTEYDSQPEYAVQSEPEMFLRFEQYKSFDWHGHIITMYRKSLPDIFEKDCDDIVYYLAMVDDTVITNVHSLGYTDEITVMNNAMYYADNH